MPAYTRIYAGVAFLALFSAKCVILGNSWVLGHSGPFSCISSYELKGKAL